VDSSCFWASKLMMMMIDDDLISVFFAVHCWMNGKHFYGPRCAYDLKNGAVHGVWSWADSAVIASWSFYNRTVLSPSPYSRLHTIIGADISSKIIVILLFNPLIATLKPQSNGPYHIAIQWLKHWPLMGELLHLVQPRSVPSSLCQM